MVPACGFALLSAAIGAKLTAEDGVADGDSASVIDELVYESGGLPKTTNWQAFATPRVSSNLTPMGGSSATGDFQNSGGVSRAARPSVVNVALRGRAGSGRQPARNAMRCGSLGEPRRGRYVAAC